MGLSILQVARHTASLAIHRRNFLAFYTEEWQTEPGSLNYTQETVDFQRFKSKTRNEVYSTPSGNTLDTHTNKQTRPHTLPETKSI